VAPLTPFHLTVAVVEVADGALIVGMGIGGGGVGVGVAVGLGVGVGVTVGLGVGVAVGLGVGVGVDDRTSKFTVDVLAPDLGSVATKLLDDTISVYLPL